MRPIETEHTNATFVHEGCGDLPAVLCHDPQTGTDYVETCWELTEEELETLRGTRRIYVSVMGNGIQPIALCTESMVKEGS